ncbi:hypothetical protein Bca101_082727 [Brassica carinata]
MGITRQPINDRYADPSDLILVPRSENLAREVVRSAGSSTHRTDSEVVLADQALPTKASGADQVKTPVIVLSDSPSKFLKAAGLVGSSFEDSETESETEDSGPKDRGREGNTKSPVVREMTTNVDPPAAPFGRISGPDQGDNEGSKDPPPG